MYFYLLTIINFWNQECLQNFKEFVLDWLNSICFFKFFQSTEFSVNLQSYFYKVYLVERLIKSRSLSIICHNFIFKWWQYEIIWLKNYIYSSQNDSSMEEVSSKLQSNEQRSVINQTYIYIEKLSLQTLLMKILWLYWKNLGF